MTTDIDEIRREHASYLYKWHWNYHATLHFIHNMDKFEAMKRVMGWCRKIKNKYPAVKFGAMIVISAPPKANPHAHILFVSDPFYPECFFFVDPEPLQDLWKHGSCAITPIHSGNRDNVTKYLVREKNIHLCNQEWCEIDFFRLNLLKALMKKPTTVPKDELEKLRSRIPADLKEAVLKSMDLRSGNSSDPTAYR